MPEVAEVRILTDNIRSFLDNKIFKRITVMNPVAHGNWVVRCCDGLQDFNDTLEKCGGKNIVAVKAHGKFCYIVLEDDLAIGIQFGMSGNIRPEPTPEFLATYKTKEGRPITKEEYMEHCLLRLEYAPLKSLESDIRSAGHFHFYYNDTRRFGRFSFFYDRPSLDSKLAKLGHDVMAEVALSNDEIIKLFRRHNDKNICRAILTNQSIIAGIGNYMKSEGLYMAGIDPRAIIRNIPDQALIDFYNAERDLGLRAYQAGGATLYTFTGISGDKSEFKNQLLVYGREGQFDKNCFNIQRIPDSSTPDGRSTFWVPEVQTIGALRTTSTSLSTNSVTAVSTATVQPIKITVKPPRLPSLPKHLTKPTK